MIIHKDEVTPQTGISLPYSSHNRLRRALDLGRVINPIIKDLARKYDTPSRALKSIPFDINSVQVGYLTDGHIHQGVDKYVELLLKEGWRLVGRDDPVEYLTKRFKLMGYMSDPSEPWELVVTNIVRDFVKYGNSFLVLRRSPYLQKATNGKIVGLNGKPPIGAYFPLPVSQLSPDSDKDGNVRSWRQKANGKEKTFNAGDVLHFTYCREPSEVWGTPFLLPVIEDVRALRQIEESILKLIYKHLNPLIHQEVPDVTGTGEGRQEDIDDAANALTTMAVDGYIITPPGHKINVIGAESQAIRAEGYVKLFKQRIFSGLGMSALAMGEAESAAIGTAESLTLQMHNKARIFHYLLSQYITHYIINELLMEGGYNPVLNEEDAVIFTWNEIEIDRRIKEQTHYLNMWSMNGIGAEEFRKLARLPIGAPSWEDYYVHQVQIPQVVAAKHGVDPILIPDADLKKVFDNNLAIATKDKPKKDSIAGQGGDASPPSNQHTPKTGGKKTQSLTRDVDYFTETCEKVLLLVPSVFEDRLTVADISNTLRVLIPEYMATPLANTLYNDIKESQDCNEAIAKVNARLANERVVILALLEGDRNDSLS